MSLSGSTPWPGTLPARLDGTFIQPWREDLALSRTGWAERVRTARVLQCPYLVLQWTRHGNDYTLAEERVRELLDLCLAAGLNLRIGFPYDPRYWSVLEGKDALGRKDFLDLVERECIDWLKGATYAAHPAFGGWYIPYELEQYSWAAPEQLALLKAFLARLVEASGPQPIAISTYRSGIPGPLTLEGLWQSILDDVGIRPMVQDGVGAFGVPNYRHLTPLFALLRKRKVAFDVVVELFAEHKPDQLEGQAFSADAADFVRLQAQMAAAGDSGAENLLAFALYPYMTGPTPGAASLHRAYEAALLSA